MGRKAWNFAPMCTISDVSLRLRVSGIRTSFNELGVYRINWRYLGSPKEHY